MEFDHVTPRASGGPSDDPANLRLLCRAHNDLEARRIFGDAAMDAAAAHRRSS
ncbi:MAG: HNH endonuclease [Elusimicrobia bacterium]|nr:HNH endonuclease [Elusimicrobiota bacterium]MDE2510702.1 HNH endonuclease [Elusimicrobiota bacterium]